MKNIYFIILLLSSFSTPAISADDNPDFRTYYQKMNLLTALMKEHEIDQLMKISNADTPLEDKLRKSGIASDKRIKEINSLFSHVLAHTKTEANQNDGAFRILLDRLRSSFEMPIEVTRSRKVMKARIALYSAAQGQKIENIRSSLIKGFENGHLSTEDMLTLIDSENKGVMGSYIDEWITNPDGTWYVKVSSLLLLK